MVEHFCSEATTEAKHQVKGGLLLDVIIRKSATVLELLASEDKALLVWRDAFLVLNLGLHVLDSVARLNIEGDGLTSEGLDENLHTTAETEHQVEGRLFLDVVVGKSTAVLELLTGEDKTLLVWGNAFFILDLGLHVLNGVAGLNIEGDGLTSEGLDENLHTTAETEHQVE